MAVEADTFYVNRLLHQADEVSDVDIFRADVGTGFGGVTPVHPVFPVQERQPFFGRMFAGVHQADGTRQNGVGAQETAM